jgi:putative transposase
LTAQEGETLRQAPAPSPGQASGLARVCHVWGVARSTVDGQRHERPPRRARRGPLGPWAAEELVDHMRRRLEASPCPGAGARKGWARLRQGGIRPAPRRVLRRRRAHQVLAPTRPGPPPGPQAHDGTMIPPHVAAMGGTAMTATDTRQEGQGAIGVAVAHSSAAWGGLQAATQGPRLAALEPIRPGGRPALGLCGQASAQGYASGMSMAGKLWHRDGRRHGALWGAPVRPPGAAHLKATAVQHAVGGPSRRLCEGSQPVLP